MWKKVYDSQADIPSGAEAFYEERDGKWHLTITVEGTTDSASVTRLESSLNNERRDHARTKEKLRAFDGLEAEDVRNKLDKLSDLEAGGNLPDEQKVSNEVERRIRSRLAPVERERDRYKSDLQTAQTERDEAKTQLTRRGVRDDLRAVASELKVVDSAVDDVMMYGDTIFTTNEAGETVTKDGVPGVAPGLKPKDWLTDQKTRRPHWWPQTKGADSQGNRGGPGGGSEVNPFSHDGWNVTEQGNLVRKDPARAEQLAKSAGTFIGGAKPARAA